MAALNHEAIVELTKLCRIDCTPEEQESMLSDLKNILKYIEQLHELDTGDIQPCNHVLEGFVNVSREDIIQEPMPREVFLANAPSHTGGMVRVPPVIKQNS